MSNIVKCNIVPDGCYKACRDAREVSFDKAANLACMDACKEERLAAAAAAKKSAGDDAGEETDSTTAAR